ncbi:hypothetical protein [Streptococcus suis]|uniref:hypothetical protein n=2 Tax=Streptococcus suis TaxID=1307 RepID=UPI00129051F0|nr:hypothetical protein [Streptococcus suis]
MKSINSHWAELFEYFYDSSLNKLSSEGFEFWKYVGDEVLFYKKICKNDLDKFHLIPKKIYEIMNELQKEIHSEFEGTQMFLALKGTLWVARVSELSLDEKNKSQNKTNILIRKHPPLNGLTIPQEYIEMIDFLGPDIDLGFRISKEAIRSQLIVSAEFVVLHNLISERIDKHTSNIDLDNYRLIRNKRLKGIWHKREYPLVLYRTEWAGRVFEYDEKEHTKDSLEKGVVDLLGEVFSSLGKESEIEKIYNIINKTEMSIQRPKKIESPVDIHLAAILFNDKGEVLLLKRGGKKSSPDKFDFGCTNLREGRKIKESLEEYYKFGDDSSLELLINETTQKPIPISLYEYEKSKEQIINGLLFAGKLNIQTENFIFDNYEYYKFYDISKINEIEMFEDSRENIARAKEMLFSSI